jgi:hypothetical protein
MARLKQLNLQYQPLEDRAYLRINTAEGAEFRFWMTRRYVQILWPVLIKLLESDDPLETEPPPEARRQILSFQQEAALRSADFDTVYREDAAEFPLGETALLLSKIQAKRSAEGPPILCMHDDTSKGIEFAISQTLLHSFCKLVSDIAQKAGWDLDLDGGLASAAVPAGDGRPN